MGHEYFSTLLEALGVFTDEQRAKDFQEFVIAMVFCKKFDLSTLTSEDEVLRAIRDFQDFLKPIRSTSVDSQTHAQIREKALSLAELLSVNENP